MFWLFATDQSSSCVYLLHCYTNTPGMLPPQTFPSAWSRTSSARLMASYSIFFRFFFRCPILTKSSLVLCISQPSFLSFLAFIIIWHATYLTYPVYCLSSLGNVSPFRTAILVLFTTAFPAYGLPGVSNLWPVGRMQPRMAVNAA